eukprot:TRINITY_DN16609_c0_g1_i4.p1 TRINITY_DN16609_c0_g1~~TRINITY_DN16609_c0_g1_i4.p1  ORF type:complete len:550 (+),score=93.67 TRINITY_DN16609_c0_g1_i4:1071-2720(+)
MSQVAVFLDFENLAQSAESLLLGDPLLQPRSSANSDTSIPNSSASASFGAGSSPSSSPARHSAAAATMSFLKGNPRPLQIDRIIDFASIQGNISIRRAYADWMSPVFLKYQRSLLENGFELVYLPRTSAQGKNGSDVRLAVDVMEVLFLQPSISTFILGTGDTDFIPLLQKVRGYNKKVIVLGFEHSVGRLVKANTNEFRPLEDILSLKVPAERAASRTESRIPSEHSSPAVLINEARNVLLRFLRNYSDQTVLMSDLKLQLLRLDSSFSQTKYGFPSFKSFIEHFVPELFSGLIRHEGGHWSAVINYNYAEGGSAVDLRDSGSLIDQVERKESTKEQLVKMISSALKNIGSSATVRELEVEFRKLYPQFNPQSFGSSSLNEVIRSLSPEFLTVWESSGSTESTTIVRLASKSPRASSKVSRAYAEAAKLIKSLKVSVSFDERLKFCSALMLKLQGAPTSMRELRTHLVRKFNCTASSARKFIGTLYSAGCFTRAGMNVSSIGSNTVDIEDGRRAPQMMTNLSKTFCIPFVQAFLWRTNLFKPTRIESG